MARSIQYSEKYADDTYEYRQQIMNAMFFKYLTQRLAFSSGA
jgi:hypothetical protein